MAGREGQQQALGGGGRYDGLIELLGGRPTPGIGFGIGLDRTVLALQESGAPDEDRGMLVGIVGTADPIARLRVATELRGRGIAVRPDGSARKLGKQLESAAKAGATWALIVAEDGSLAARHLERGEQQDGITIDGVVALVSA